MNLRGLLEKCFDNLSHSCNINVFLFQVSGLDKNMTSSDHPLKYSHLDIAGSSGRLPHPTTGASVTALVMQFLAN